MTPERLALARAIHAQTETAFALCVTGGASLAAGWLLAVPGGSKTVAEVAIPYSERALADYLGAAPASYCSEETAAAMARRALQRCRQLTPDAGRESRGFACTASLATDRPKKGEHRFFVAAASANGVTGGWRVFEKGRRTRGEEEAELSDDLLAFIAMHVGPHGQTSPDFQFHPGRAEGLQKFFSGELSWAGIGIDGRLFDRPPTLVFPGSFRPWHEGHRLLAAEAEKRLGGQVCYEISLANVDKPSAGADDALRRAEQFAGHAPACLTRAPTFAEKARLFPGATFVLGADTAARLFDAKYYPGGVGPALAELRAAGCRFFVGGRLSGEGFVTLDGLAVPGEYRDLFAGLREDEFRADVSSTAIRMKQKD